MPTFFYLSSCSTCHRIIKELNLKSIILQDVKNQPITKDQIEKMADMAGSYDTLLNKRAIKYKSMDLKNKNLTEEDIKHLIINEYTFLKRPILVLKDKIVIGNSKNAVQDMKQLLPQINE